MVVSSSKPLCIITWFFPLPMVTACFHDISSWGGNLLVVLAYFNLFFSCFFPIFLFHCNWKLMAPHMPLCITTSLMCMLAIMPPHRCASTFLVWLLGFIISMANNTKKRRTSPATVKGGIVTTVVRLAEAQWNNYILMTAWGDCMCGISFIQQYMSMAP